MENLLKPIFEAADRTSSFDNRSYFVRSLNTLLNKGIIKVQICGRNKVWTRKSDGAKYNVNIQYPIPNTGKVYSFQFKYGTIIKPSDILDAVAKCINREAIQSHIKEHFTISVNGTSSSGHVCGKCNGFRIIEAFKHVCSGICFDCGGSGLPFKGEYKSAELSIIKI